MEQKNIEVVENNEVVTAEVSTNVETVAEVKKEKFFDKHPKLGKGLKIAGGIVAGATALFAVGKISNKFGYASGVSDALAYGNDDDELTTGDDFGDIDETNFDAPDTNLEVTEF